MATTVLSASRAGLNSVIVTDPTTFIITIISDLGVVDPGFIKVPGLANMDGVTSVTAIGRGVITGAAQMDGHADVFSTGANLHPGAAHMDGTASVSVSGTPLFRGVAHMDGQAQVQAVSANVAPGVVNMDGRASAVVMQSVPGAGLTEMDGAASMLAVAPNRYNLYLQDGVVGSDALVFRTAYHVSLLQNVVSSDALKPKLRYHVVSSNAINLSSAINFKMRFVKVLRDVAITITPSLAPQSQFHYTFTFPIDVQPTLTPKWRAVLGLTQNLTVSQTTLPKFIWGRALIEAIRVSTSLDAHAQYRISLAQLIKLFEVEGLKLRHPVTLNQAINLSHLLTGGIGVKLLQKLLATSTASPKFNYHFTLDSRIKIKDTLEHLVDAILAELFTVHATLGRQFIAGGSLSQLLTVHPALNNKLILKLVGNIQVSPEQLVHMLYRGDSLLDKVTITALYISPSGNTTTWTVNTRTAAVTEYLNYDFHSFALLGNRYVAAGSDGLYELDGDTDDGALIIGDLMGGYLQLNEKKLFGIKGAYVAIRGGGRFYLKLIAGDSREYVYELKAQPNMMTTKVKVGKGISTTYMAWELITEGQDFDLDSIEFIPMTRGRRV